MANPFGISPLFQQFRRLPGQVVHRLAASDAVAGADIRLDDDRRVAPPRFNSRSSSGSPHSITCTSPAYLLGCTFRKLALVPAEFSFI